MYKHAIFQFKRASWSNVGRAATKHPNILGVKNVTKGRVQKALIDKFGRQVDVNKAAADALKKTYKYELRLKTIQPISLC